MTTVFTINRKNVEGSIRDFLATMPKEIAGIGQFFDFEKVVRDLCGRSMVPDTIYINQASFDNDNDDKNASIEMGGRFYAMECVLLIKFIVFINRQFVDVCFNVIPLQSPLGSFAMDPNWPFVIPQASYRYEQMPVIHCIDFPERFFAPWLEIRMRYGKYDWEWWQLATIEKYIEIARDYRTPFRQHMPGVTICAERSLHGIFGYANGFDLVINAPSLTNKVYTWSNQHGVFYCIQSNMGTCARLIPGIDSNNSNMVLTCVLSTNLFVETGKVSSDLRFGPPAYAIFEYGQERPVSISDEVLVQVARFARSDFGLAEPEDSEKS